MAKKNRTKSASEIPAGEVGPRQPCPCGSGKRYKACHGAPGGGQVFVKRPFEGLPSECDIVAMRELVPAATATLALTGEHADRVVKLCTLLPMAAPALVRDSGEVWLGLQVQHAFGDPARDLGAVLLEALAAEPGAGMIGLTNPPGPGPRLQDLVADGDLAVEVHEGFDYWVSDMDPSSELAQALEQADGAAAPTARLTEVTAAYWTRMGAKEHLRWVMPEPEDALLDALARLHVTGDDVIVPDARFVGMFRAHGLLTPVWDLPVGTGAEALEEPAAAFKAQLDAALADTSDLTTEQRSARNGLANRQVTIR
ncbi:topoisomerase II [Pimelobacter simplex]|uniref:Uncharacterized protein n=1 Tax=Nocardioides simplex TaxID=2045 RepID=A0A0A1DPP0_NOCSI|nr:DUF5926 family protein [Pimelobacter simplex]AIY19349.1 hypothetical protein KR76_25905 [Pimelobacter simplex]MCG8149473.1 topoisomerase II [Pimelobacter simplex]GEB16156.1 preprotein translocase SecA [Pimelobacter simplex]SFM18593.1 SEC-C motif-containing protein [Pimelobacter simplex]